MIQVDGMMDVETAGRISTDTLINVPAYDPAIEAEFNLPLRSVATFLDVPLFDGTGLLNLLVRFLLNFLVAWVLVHFLYYRKSKRMDYYVTFMLFSSTMFLLLAMLDNVKLQIGFALGLFAIFGMIRYRTETVPIREMTYLFVLIGLSIINGLAMSVSWSEMLLLNLLLLGMAFFLENWRGLPQRSAKIVLYDKIDNIRPERHEELVRDLEQRLGRKIESVEIGHVDFLRDVAYIKVYYMLRKNETNTIDSIVKLR